MAKLRGLLIPSILLGIWSAGPAAAQDRRSVSEPGLPTQICATLAAAPDAAPGSDTRRLQAAIDHCRAGAAVRLVPAGAARHFESGPLVMKSGVSLWIDAGAVLAATPDPAAYDLNGQCGRIDAKGKGCRAFLSFLGTHGGGLVGDGVIEGRGDAAIPGHGGETWWQLARRAQREGGKQNNPRLIEIDDARDITFYRITLRNAANFHVAMNHVEGATFWGVRIDTPADARNTDGIDPGAAQDVTIARSYIRTGDDNIAIKAGKGATRHVSIVDSHFFAGHGVSIGSETNAGVSDVLVRHVSFEGTSSGLRIKSDASRGGLVRGILYEDVCLRGVKRPIEFDTRYDRSATGLSIPVYRDIVLRNIEGDSGTLVVRGHDAGHPIEALLDGVRFGPAAQWQTEFAALTIGPNGAAPTPPGLAPTAMGGGGRCAAGRWPPMPSPAAP